MRPLTVLLTASGVPGSAALVRALRENGERELRLVGTDMSELAIGRHFCDAFHVVPAGDDPGFVDALAEICKRELDILWHDYFNPTHLEKYPDLHTKFWNADKLASRNKQNLDEAAANDLLNQVNEIAEIFWATKGVPTRRGPSNQTAGGEFVYPANQG